MSERHQELGETLRAEGGDVLGRRVGRYVIEGCLGRGGMGTVWRGVHDELGSAVAIKVLESPDDDEQRRFVQEAVITARLDHQNIVRVFDFVHDVVLGSCIVMELVPGSTLDTVLADEGPLSSARAVGIGIQVANALAAAHAAGIVHRDLKPGNVFVKRLADGDFVKVVDFGIAKAVGNGAFVTTTGCLVGTPAYMSPEQWDGRPASTASDVYALGALLFESLTGRLPVLGRSLAELARNVVLTTPPPLRALRPDVPAALEGLVMRCLEKSPERRFASMADVALALRGLRGSETTLPPAPPSVRSAVSARPPRSAFLPGIAAALAVLSLFGSTALAARVTLPRVVRPNVVATTSPVAAPVMVATAAPASPAPEAPAASDPAPVAAPAVPPAVVPPSRPSPSSHARAARPRPARPASSALVALAMKPPASDDDDLLHQK